MSLKKDLDNPDYYYTLQSINKNMFEREENLDLYLITNSNNFSEALKYITMNIQMIKFSMNEYISNLIKKIDSNLSITYNGFEFNYIDLEKYKNYFKLLKLNYLILFYFLMSKPEYNAQIYNMQLRLLTGKHIEIIVYSKIYVPGYDMNEMISYLINEQISVDDLLSEWRDRQDDVKEYLEVGELSNQVIKDWIQEINKVDTELKTRTKGGLRLQDIKGSLDDIRTTKYKDLKTIDFINILIRNYNGDVLAMMKSADKGELNTKMEEEKPGYADDIVIEKENKVPIKQDKSIDRTALKFGKFTVELPNDPSEVNVTDEEVQNKLDEERVQIQGKVFIFYEDNEDNASQENQIHADISNLFSNYKELEKWMKDRRITEEPLKYLIKLIINDMKELGAFQLAVQSRYERREKEKAERKKKEAESKKNQSGKGVGLKEMRSMKSEVKKEVSEASTKKKSRRIVKESSTDTGITTEKKEPVQQSSTIYMGTFPDEQENKTKSVNNEKEDLTRVEKEKEEFDSSKYGLDKGIKIGDIELEFKKEQPKIDNIEELKNYDNVALINKYLGDKLDYTNDQLTRYAKYLGWKYSTYLLLLLMIRDQKQIEIFKKIYGLLKREEELLQVDKDLQIKDRKLKEDYKKQQEEIARHDKEIKEMHEKMLSQVKEDRDRNEEERKRNEELRKKNEEESIRLEKDKKAIEEKKVEVDKQSEYITKFGKEVYEMDDANKEQWKQLQKEGERLNTLSNQLNTQAQILNEQSQQFAQQPINQSFTNQSEPPIQPVNQTIVEEPVQSIPSPEEIITELLKNDENMKQVKIIEGTGIDIRVHPVDEEVIKKYEKKHDDHLHRIRTEIEKMGNYAMIVEKDKIRSEKRKRMLAAKRSPDSKRELVRIREERILIRIEEEREKLFKQLYGDLYDTPINDSNRFDMTLGVVRALLGNITMEEFNIILSNIKSKYAYLKIYGWNDFELRYILQRMYQPKQLKEELEKIIKENSKEL